MAITDKIELLDRYLSVETVNDSDEKESEIFDLIESITNELINSPEVLTQITAELLNIYERHNSKSLDYLIGLINYWYKQLDSLEVAEFDLPKYTFKKTDDELVGIGEKVLEEFSKSGLKKIQLSNDFEMKLSFVEIVEFIQLVNLVLNNEAEKINTDADQIENLYLYLAITRNISKAIGRGDVFYFLAGSFLDILHKQEKFQLARNVVEDCLICGYKDKNLDLAFFIAFNVYSNTSSILVAAHYAICSLKCSLMKDSIFDRSYKMWIWKSIKFYRNAGAHQLAVDVYEQRPKKIQFEGYDARALANTYFMNLLFMKDTTLLERVADFIDKNREEIINGGELESMPLLNTLYNIQYNYNKELTGMETCVGYITLFERIVPPEKIKRSRDAFVGSLADNVQHLKSALVNLAATKYAIDFSTDNRSARVISNRVLEKAFYEGNFEAYLLSMILNSDYSIVIKPAIYTGIEELDLSERVFEDLYFPPASIRSFLNLHSKNVFIWLGSTNTNVLPVIFDNEPIFKTDSIFKLSELKNWYSSSINDLPLNETKVIRKGTENERKVQKVEIDYIEEDAELAKSFPFPTLKVDNLRNVLVIKDYECSILPHNLILNSTGSFVYSKNPIMNILSMEWLIQRQDSGTNFLVKDYSKSIWIPTDFGDFILNWLYKHLEPTIIEHNFTINTGNIPSSPLKSNINIVAAHGNQEISSFPALYAKNEKEKLSIIDLNSIIGKGDILILFVCHSGSMKADFLRNRLSSLIREYLKSGYEAVIAPFWALDIDIAKFCLPVFLESINSGNEVIKAVHDGNMIVKEKFPSAKAYACLHAYGNPFFKLIH